MQRNSSRRSNSMTPIGWGFVWLCLGMLLAAWPAGVLGQEPPPPPPPDGSPYPPSYYLRGGNPNDAAPPPRSGELSDLESDSFWFSDRFTGRGQQSIGAMVRGGAVVGNGIGRDVSIFPVEFMPYSMYGNSMFFGDLRGFRSTQDHYGANVGGGYRYYAPQLDRIFGGYAFYDYDNTSTKLFRQVSFGLETYGAAWDMRLNTYFPTQTDSKLLNVEFIPSSVRFSGYNILYNQLRTIGTPMTGLDHELGVPLPGRFSTQHDVRAYAGWYLFDGKGIDHTLGWKTRLQAYATPNVALGLEVMNDHQFNTNVVFSVAISYGGYHEPTDRPTSQFSRMTTPVYRQYNVVVARTGVLDVGLVAMKPDGTPYFVEHVASTDPYDRNNLPLMRSLAPQYNPNAPLGTYENPFVNIADAQAPKSQLPHDIIYVWTNGVYNNTQVNVSESNVRILGDADGVVHTFLLQPFGQVALPRAVNNPDPTVVEARPLFTNTIGDGVVLSASNAEFSGFQIGSSTNAASGPTGNGLSNIDPKLGNVQVTNVDVRFDDINFAQQDGVRLNGVGSVHFFETRIFNAALNGLHIDGGRPNVIFEGDGNPATGDIVYNSAVQGGNAVLIENTLAGSFVDLFAASPSAINYTNGGGVVVENSAGSARFGDITIANTIPTLPEGINLLNDSGAYTFSSAINVNKPFGDGINIENLSATGVATFLQPVTITDRGAHGVDLINIAGNGDPTRFSVTFRNDLNITTALPANYSASPAIEYHRNDQTITQSGAVAFQNISIDGGNGEGIRIGVAEPNVAGQFLVRGLTNILNVAGINLDITDDSTVTFNGVSIDRRGDSGIHIVDNDKPITFNSRTIVGNFLVLNNLRVFNSTAVLITGNTLTAPVLFENLTVTDSYNGRSPFAAGLASNPGDTVAGVAIGTNGSGPNSGNPGNPGSVTFNSLSVSTLAAAGNVNNAGVALGARFVGTGTATPITGGLFVGAGVINAFNAPAIDVEASVVGMTFDAVSATTPIGPGILMANNYNSTRTPALDVLGDGAGLINQGGTITGARQLPLNTPLELFSQITGPATLPTTPLLSPSSGAGVLLRNTGDVVLNKMLISANQVGIDVATDATHLGLAGETDVLTVTGSTVQSNLTFGLDALNVQTMTVTTSTFSGNGPGLPTAGNLGLPFFNNNEIRSQADANINQSTISTLTPTGLKEVYTWRFNQNTISDVDGNAVVLQTLGGGIGSTLNLSFTNNNVSTLANLSGVANPGALDLVGPANNGWNGPLNALIDRNNFQFLAANSSGIQIATPSVTDLAIVTITNNTFQGNGIGNVGLDITTGGPSSYLVDRNSMQLNNPASGMRFFLAPGSVTTISNNTIDIPTDPTILTPNPDGITFASITAPATVRIEGNNLTIGTLLPLDERGIDFQATSGIINFLGNTNNIVTLDGLNGINFPYFVFPVNGQFTGSILVNGVPHP